jgi:endonuclease/exonuclease/phosphatase family metal-dependent hydrolase
MRLLLSIVPALALMISNASISIGGDVPSNTAQVVGWNLSGFSPIPRDRVPPFARALADLDPEVIGLVEVNPDFVAGELVAEFNELDLCYKRKLLDQSASQNIAVLHKCSVGIGNPRLIPGSDDGNSGLRKALAVDVRIGEFDFLLITVHMKASRGPGPRSVRDNQAAAIATFIGSETSGAEKDVLLIGDYNMIPGEDDSNFSAMSPGGFLKFISSEDLIGQGTHLRGDGSVGNLLDGYAVSNGHTQEYVAGSLRIFPMHRALGLTLQQYRNQVSDHLPVIATFRITGDDD